MKKISLSIVALAAMNTFAIAGGDITPAEPVVAPSNSGFYVGLAYSYISNDTTLDYADFDWKDTVDTDHNAGMLQVGYQFNQYIAIEGRYWFAASEDDTWHGRGGGGASDSGDMKVDYDAWGIYVKPMYPVTDAFTVYGLLGYAHTNYDMIQYDRRDRPVKVHGLDDGGFSWGLGASYAITENLSIFADYTCIYNDDIDVEVDRYISLNRLGTPLKANADIRTDSWNIGLTYRF